MVEKEGDRHWNIVEIFGIRVPGQAYRTASFP